VKRAVLAIVEAALVLAIALLLSLILVGGASAIYSIASEHRSSAGRDVEVPLRAVSPRASEPAVVVAAVRDLGVATRVALEEDHGEPTLVVEGLSLGDFRKVREVLREHGYQSEKFSFRTELLPSRLAALWDGPLTPPMIAGAVTVQAVVFGGLGLVMIRWRLRPRNPDAGKPWPRAVLMGLGFGAAAIVGTIVISTIMKILGLEVHEQTWVIELARNNARALWYLAPWTVLVGPITEEVFFRGYLFRFLSQEVGAAFGYGVSALAFAAIHFNPPAFPLYVFYGLLLAFALRSTSRLSASIAAHMTINVVSTVVLFLTAGKLTV
jgi:membrane protease YdiL (CAAX protease family)